MNANAARISLDALDTWEYHTEIDLALVEALRAGSPGVTTHEVGRSLSARSKKLLRYLIRHGHWSVFMHCSLTVRVKCPIFVRTQMFRHTSIAPNEVSGRYVTLKDEWFVPKAGEFRKQAETNRQASVADDGSIDQEQAHNIYAKACEDAYAAYKALLALGVTREQARGVLPQSMITEFYFSGTVRSWLHFFSARIHEGAQFETQRVAEAIRDVFAEIYPETLAAHLEIEAEKAENAEFAAAYRSLLG